MTELHAHTTSMIVIMARLGARKQAERNNQPANQPKNDYNMYRTPQLLQKYMNLAGNVADMW
jgi:hypothetical protein